MSHGAGSTPRSDDAGGDSGSRDLWQLGALGVALVASVAIIACLLVVGWISFTRNGPDVTPVVYTLGNYIDVATDPRGYVVIGNTLIFSGVALCVAFAFGIPIAWLVERTDMRRKPLIFTLMTIGLLMPGFASAMGWLFLLHPRIGLINTWLQRAFGIGPGAINISSVVGMGWVEGLNLAPLAFIMTAAVVKAMDPTLEETASMSGAGATRIMRAVTLPLAWPGVMAAAIYIFTIGFATFDVPAVIGMGNRVFTFSTYLYFLTRPEEAFPRYGFAAALGAFVALISCGTGFWYARMQRRARMYAVVSGRAYRPRVVELRGRASLAWSFLIFYFLLADAVPILVVIWSSLLPYFQLPSAQAFAQIGLRHYYSIPWALAVRGFVNTAILMALTPTLTLAISLCFSWTTLRTRYRGRALLDFIAFLPHAIPNIVFGVGVLLITLYILRDSVPIYGTLWVLLFAYLVARVSYGTRMTNAGLIQIHPELVESAQSAGAGLAQIVRRIVAPILAPTLVYAWLWIALLTYRELTLSVILTTPRNMTIPLVIWTTWLGGGLAQSSALVVVMLCVMIPLTGLYWLIAGRRGILSV